MASRLDTRPAARSRELDRQAEELLLAVTRLARVPRHDRPPRELRELLHSGAVAPRHLAAFAVVALFGPLTVSELAAREGIAVSTASLLVTELARAGLVERREDEEDHRRTLVSVAPAHRRQSQKYIESKLAPMRRGLARLGPKRAQALLDAMAALAEEFAGDPAAAAPQHLPAKPSKSDKESA
jgi:DNA-binding MarR family transcriptional regulator